MSGDFWLDWKQLLIFHAIDDIETTEAFFIVHHGGIKELRKQFEFCRALEIFMHLWNSSAASLITFAWAIRMLPWTRDMNSQEERAVSQNTLAIVERITFQCEKTAIAQRNARQAYFTVSYCLRAPKNWGIILKRMLMTASKGKKSGEKGRHQRRWGEREREKKINK